MVNILDVKIDASMVCLFLNVYIYINAKFLRVKDSKKQFYLVRLFFINFELIRIVVLFFFFVYIQSSVSSSLTCHKLNLRGVTAYINLNPDLNICFCGLCIKESANEFCIQNFKTEFGSFWIWYDKFFLKVHYPDLF